MKPQYTLSMPAIAPRLEDPPQKPPLEGGELVGVGAPKRPSPNDQGAAVNEPRPERRGQPSKAEPRVPRK